MSNALVKSSRRKRSGWSGVVPAACSAIVPGVGQLINGDTDKAIGVFVVAAVSGVAFLGALPVIGPIAGLVSSVTWLYAIGDGYLQGRKAG